MSAENELERLRAELARLHEGEADDPGDPGTWPTPAQWIRRWNDMTPQRRLEIAGGAVDGMQAAARCRYQPGHGGQIAELRAERDALKAAIEGVRSLHARNANTGDCEYCSEHDYPDYAAPWPCPTIRALVVPETSGGES